MTARRYIVIGAGAVGALLAGQLALAGVSVVLVARGGQLDAIRSGGVRIRRPHSTDVVQLPVVAGPSELSLEPSDVLVLTTKTQDAQAVFSEWAWVPLAGGGAAADLPMLTFQNGLATEDLALRWFSRVYGVSIAVSASYLQAGEVVCGSDPVIGVTWVGAYPSGPSPSGPFPDEFVADFAKAGFAAHAVDDIRSWKAQKLLVNVGINGVDLLAGTDEERGPVIGRLVAEAQTVYAAAGITLPPDSLVREHLGELKMEPVPGMPAGALHASTWQSFARGRPSELDWLNGEIVRLARLLGVAAPLNVRLQHLLGAQAAAGQPAGTHSIAELLQD